MGLRRLKSHEKQTIQPDDVLPERAKLGCSERPPRLTESAELPSRDGNRTSTDSRWVWPFELLDKLGEGGMGVVYRARYVGNDRIVAVKILPDEVAKNATLLARFEREVELLKNLKHPNIVHSFGGTCESQQRFYAMELVDGGTLADQLNERGHLTWDRVIDYGLQICAALQFAHERGIIHRDIKPGNFLLTKSGKVKLADFGLAAIQAGHRLTAAGKTLGTFHYMSPEQIRGKPPISNRTDLYALGCVFYELLTGRPPYDSDTVGEILNLHLKAEIPHVLAELLDCPVELDDLITSLMQKNPDDRPKDAATVAVRLQAILQPSRARTSPVDLFAHTRNDASPVTNPVKVRGSAPAIPIPKESPTSFRAHVIWGLVCAVLVLTTIANWRGWHAAADRAARAERTWVKSLSHHDPAQRSYALDTLSVLAPWESTTTEAILAARDDPEPNVRTAAYRAFEQNPEAARSHLAEFVGRLKREEQPTVRQQIEATVRALNQPRARKNWVSWALWAGAMAVLAAILWAGWSLWKRAEVALGGR